VLAYISRMNGIPEEKLTELLAQDEAASLIQGHLARLNLIPATKTTYLNVVDTGAGGGSRVSGRRAAGGPVLPGGSYLVGEQGPELVTFGQHGMVHNAATTAAAMSGGTTTVTFAPVVNIYGDASGDDVVNKLATHVRRNGPGTVRNLLGV
jgi:hypothetical protein